MRPSVTNNAFAPNDTSLETNPMVYLSKLFIYFLQNLFREFPENSGMRWTPNEETSQIIISNEKPKNSTSEKLPAITVILGSGRMSGIGLDQMQYTDMSQGGRTHTDLMPMNVTFHCMSKSGQTARMIAWNAGFYTNVYRRILMRVGKLHHVSPSWDMSAEGPASALTGVTSIPELITVMVNVPFFWQPQWRITEPVTLWRNLRIQLSVRKGGIIYKASEVNKTRPPKIPGVPSDVFITEEPEIDYTQEIFDTKSDD